MASKFIEGSRIRVARMARKMRPIDLARKLGVSAATVRAWERGDRECPESRLWRIADVLRFPDKFFIGKPVELISADSISW